MGISFRSLPDSIARKQPSAGEGKTGGDISRGLDFSEGTVRSKVFLNQTSTRPTDWNIATAVLYKSYSALDGLAGKLDPITLKHFGSAEARTQAGAKRADLWTTVSSVLGREIMMKP
jgi:hypothetical protein